MSADPTEIRKSPVVLIVEDDHNLGRVMTLLLESEGCAPVLAASGEAALQMLDDLHPAFALTDLRLPGIDGIELLERLLARRPILPVAVISAHGDIPEALRALQAGAVDFLVKPVGREQLMRCLRPHLFSSGSAASATVGGLSFDTRSPRMRAVLDTVRVVARTDAPVLITGASGSGKEVLAKAIHRSGARAAQSWVAINCAAMPAALLESELFGHVRGAFTGAVADNPGLFRAAHGGTIFLDEIGDMPLALQSKLLRVLQEREVTPVGATQPVPVNVRVLAATHRQLEDCIAAGTFRTDLYYRLNVLAVSLPTLEERREDVPLLVASRLRELRAAGAPHRYVSPEGMDALASANWPGNVRQLFNVVERLVALAPSPSVDVALVQRCLGEQGAMPSFDDARMQYMRHYLRRQLARTGGNITQAAVLAGRNRADFYKLLGRYGIATETPAERVPAPN